MVYGVGVGWLVGWSVGRVGEWAGEVVAWWVVGFEAVRLRLVQVERQDTQASRERWKSRV